MPTNNGHEPDQEFVGDVLGIEQVFASVGLSVDPSPNESLEDVKQSFISAPSHSSGSNWLQGQRMVSDVDCEASSINGGIPLPTFGQICDRLYLIQTFHTQASGCYMMVALDPRFSRPADPLLPRPLLV
jgi:hypothetical protein